MDWTTVYLAFDSADAHLVGSFLESEGYSVLIKGEIAAAVVAAPATTGGIEVQVPAARTAEALALLAVHRRPSQ